MDKSTLAADNSSSVVSVGEAGSSPFPHLTLTETVLVWSAIIIAILAVIAIFLRLMMPLIRSRLGKASPQPEKMPASTSNLGVSSRPSVLTLESFLTEEGLKNESKTVYHNMEAGTTTPFTAYTPNLQFQRCPNSHPDKLDTYSMPGWTSRLTQQPLLESVASMDQLLKEDGSSVASNLTTPRRQSLNMKETYLQNWDLSNSSQFQRQELLPLPQTHH